jgi:hypothetical protein
MQDRLCVQSLPFSTTSVAIGHDAAASDLSEALEFTLEPLLINVPAEVTDEEILDTFASIHRLRFGLFDGGFIRSLSLALLGGSRFLFLVAFGRIIGVAILSIRVRLIRRSLDR